MRFSDRQGSRPKAAVLVVGLLLMSCGDEPAPPPSPSPPSPLDVYSEATGLPAPADEVGYPSIAEQLNAIEPAWQMTDQGVEDLISLTCSEGDFPTAIEQVLPGADLRAVSALNRVTFMIFLRCSGIPPDVAGDWNSTLYFTLLSNTPANPVLPQHPLPTEGSSTQRAVCNTLDAFDRSISEIADEIVSIASRERIEGGVVLDLVVSAAILACPIWFPVAAEVVGDLLQG
jgi:hypothetical protein